MENIIHKFEEAGLGKAPFTFEYATWEDWSSCQFCSHEIKQKCYIKDVNGKMFYVGNECVNHTGDQGLIDTAKVHINALKRKLRHEREATQIENARLLLYGYETVRNKFAEATNYKEDFVQKFIHEKLLFGGTKYKLDLSKKVFEITDERTLEHFHKTKENILWKYNEEKRLEAVERKRVEEERQKEWAAKREKILTDNADIIKILEGMNQSPFVTSMISQLKFSEIKQFSPRQREVLSDIYAKTFGKNGTEEYKTAYAEFYRRGL